MLYRLLALVLVPLCRVVVRLRVSGLEHLPADGSVLLVPNHVSWVDPIVVCVAAWLRRRRLRFLVIEGAFRVPVVGAVLRATKQIPVRQSGSRASSLLAAQAALRGGGAVVVYPEGTIPPRGERVPARPGVGVLSQTPGVPVVPVATWGMERGRAWWPRRRVGVIFGAPLDVPDGDREQRATFILDSVHRCVPAARRLAEGHRT